MFLLPFLPFHHPVTWIPIDNTVLTRTLINPPITLPGAEFACLNNGIFLSYFFHVLKSMIT